MCGFETAFPLHRWRERETRFHSGYSFPFALPSCTLLAQTPKVNLLCLIDSFLLGVASKSLAPLHPLQSNLQTLNWNVPKPVPTFPTGILPSSLSRHFLSSEQLGKLGGGHSWGAQLGGKLSTGVALERDGSREGWTLPQENLYHAKLWGQGHWI